MGIDVIVRLHDPSRLMEFDSSLFSLLNQIFKPVHAVVVTQSFQEEATARVRALIDAFDWKGRGHEKPSLVNVEAPAGVDIRAQLLNVGIDLTRYRFLAFLDGDDYLYESAYDYLVREALSSGAALAFGSVICRHVRVFEKFVYSAVTIKDLFKGKNLNDLLTDNFCPIHSFIVDRNQISPDDLNFNSQLRRLEDYDFLLRLSSKYPTHFESLSKVVGVYNWHLDGRGATQFGRMDAARQAENEKAWIEARRHVWKLKTKLRSESVSSIGGPGEPEDRQLSPVTDPGQDEIPQLFPPGHFYSPVVNPADLLSQADRVWSRQDTLPGIDLNAPAQLELLRELSRVTTSIDYPVEDPGDQSTYFYKNDQFPVLDAEFLHASLVHRRPRTMIEIGSGFSSLITAKVNRELLGNQLDFTCIEPYPRQFLLDGVSGITRLVPKKVEDVDPAFFNRLGADDILFIDSSHVVKTGSDVNYLFAEILPRLKVGVLVHIHDIFLPDEYPRDWVLNQGRNWNEQYLLRAFLQFNASFSIVWAARFMATRYPTAVQATFPRFPELGGGGSFWIRKIR
jgi:Methyltransferase domain